MSTVQMSLSPFAGSKNNWLVLYREGGLARSGSGVAFLASCRKGFITVDEILEGGAVGGGCAIGSDGYNESELNERDLKLEGYPRDRGTVSGASNQGRN
jgi:hypothetical protein